MAAFGMFILTLYWIIQGSIVMTIVAALGAIIWTLNAYEGTIELTFTRRLK